MGLVRAVAVGTALIVATHGTIADTAAVQVSAVPVASISVAPTSATLIDGGRIQLTPTLRDSAGNVLSGRVVTWGTNNPTVATVDGNGLVIAGSAGGATITASSDAASTTVPVTVQRAAVASIRLTPASATLNVGDSVRFAAATFDAAGRVLTGRLIEWDTPTPALITVRSNGTAVGLVAGTATVRARSEGVAGTATVSISSSPTNPPPGPGAGEPVFVAGSSQQLFAEDFEVYRDKADLVTWQSHYPSRYAVRDPEQIELRTTGAFAGQKSARFHWPVSETYHDADVLLEVTNVSGSAVPVVVYQFMVRYKAGFPFKRRADDRNGAGYKLFIHNLKGEGWERVVMGGGSVLPQFFPEYEAGWPERIAVNFSIGDLYYQTNLNGKLIDGDGYLNDGQWHRFTVRMTGSTFRTRTTGNGRLEVWVDGTKILEYLGDVSGRPEYGKVAVPRTADGLFDSLQFPSVFNGGPGPAQGDQWVEFDNLRVWRP